jgi:hypothetical protein
MGMPNTANLKQLGWAALGVVAGLALFNTLRTVAGNSIVGKALSGDLARRG